MNNILEHLKIFLFFFPKHVFQLAKGYWEKKKKIMSNGTPYFTSKNQNLAPTHIFLHGFFPSRVGEPRRI